MDLESRLGRALEELWQAALTVSTLKYVAGLVSQDINLISNSLGELDSHWSRGSQCCYASSLMP